MPYSSNHQREHCSVFAYSSLLYSMHFGFKYVGGKAYGKVGNGNEVETEIETKALIGGAVSSSQTNA